MKKGIVRRIVSCAILVALGMLVIQPLVNHVVAQGRAGPKAEDVSDCTNHGIKLVKPSGELWKFLPPQELKDMNKPGMIPTVIVLQKSQGPDDFMQVEVYVRIYEHQTKLKIKEKDKKGKEVEKELLCNDVKGIAKYIEKEAREQNYTEIKEKEYVKNEKKAFKGTKRTGIEFSFKAKLASGEAPAYCRQVFIADNGRTYQIQVHVVDTSPTAAQEKKDFTWNDKLKKDIDFIFDSFTIYKVKPPVADDQGG